MHGCAVMIYKGQALDDIQRLAAFDDMPNLATLRFGYKKCRKDPTFFVGDRSTQPVSIRI